MAESHRNEIARLEALFSAHPEGRMFTHLAEAYRKAGELDRAREVLESGLRRHPDYASAHVVLGRVLSDQGKVEEAASAFRRVLELDPQNLVALRASADLARAAGRWDEALGYYREILALDPTNEEVAGLVQGLEAAGPVEGAAAAEPDWQEGWGWEGGEQAAEPAGGTGTADEAPLAETGFTPTDWDELTAEPAEPESLESGSVDLPFEEGADFGSLADLPGFDEGSVDLAEPAGLSPADAVDEAVALGAAEVEHAPGSGAEGPPVREPHAGPEAWLLDNAGEDLGAELVTETMGDVYARQGLYARAAQVYRELLRERPGDERLASKLAEAEAQAQARPGAGEPGGPGTDERAPVVEPVGETEPFGALEAEPWAGEAGTPGAAASTFDLAPEESASSGHAFLEIEAAWTGAAGALEAEHTPYAWAEETGPGENRGGAAAEPSIGEYFRALLAWRPGAGEVVAAESPLSVVATASEPFALEQASAAPAAVGEVEDEIDQLFGAELAAPPESKPEEAEPPQQPRGGDDDDDDLEMFRAWLQSLKR